jgi:hypothetical protein
MLFMGMEPVDSPEHGLILLRDGDTYVTSAWFEYTPEVYCYLDNYKEREV